MHLRLNSKGGPVSLEGNHLKHTQPLSNIYFIKIGKRGRGRGREIQVEHNSLPFWEFIKELNEIELNNHKEMKGI